jgi:excinuclease ABC subunit A
LYAEGQRRFVESFSPYARQFLERLERPPVTSLEPVPAGIAVDRRAPVKSSRSTVATMADLEAYLSALFLRESVPVCPEHGVAAQPLSPLSAADRLLSRFPDQRVVLTYREFVSSAEEFLERRQRLTEQGFLRFWIDGAVRSIDEVRPSEVMRVEQFDVVLDRVTAKESERDRIAAAIEQAWERGLGAVRVVPWSAVPSEVPAAKPKKKKAAKKATKKAAKRGKAAKPEPEADPGYWVLRAGLSCPECSRPMSEAVSGLFSYDSPVGACPTCRGFGRTIGVDFDKVIPDDSKSLAKGAIRPWTGKSTAWERGALHNPGGRSAPERDLPLSRGTLLRN